MRYGILILAALAFLATLPFKYGAPTWVCAVSVIAAAWLAIYWIILIIALRALAHALRKTAKARR